MYRQKEMEYFRLWVQEHQSVADKERGQGDIGIITSPKIEIQMVDDATGYGIFASKDINLGEVLIQIPLRFIINAQFVAKIPEYFSILKRCKLNPSEMLILFFVFERVYFKHIINQECNFNNESLGLTANTIKTAIGKSCEFLSFLQSRAKRITDNEVVLTDIWWKPYFGILPCEFGTPLFKFYLYENGEEKLRNIAAQLPQQAKEKLIGQMVELKQLEQKMIQIILSYEPSNENHKDDKSVISKPENYVQKQDDCVQKLDDSLIFWKENICWAWHIVNTRCIFVDNLPLNQLIDVFSNPNTDDHDVTFINSYKSSTFPNQRFSNKNKCKKVEVNEGYDGALALIPLVDMLNHNPDGQCTPSFDKISNLYVVRAEHHALKQGEQLFICYGAYDNAQLWIDYGFRIEDNPFNKVAISIELFIAFAEICGIRVNSYRKEIMTKADLPCTIYATDDLPSYGLRKNCSILLLPKDRMTNWSRHIFFKDDEDEFEEANSREMQLLEKILQRLEKSLCARKGKCVFDEAQTFWFDQIQILRKVLVNLKKIY